MFNPLTRLAAYFSLWLPARPMSFATTRAFNIVTRIGDAQSVATCNTPVQTIHLGCVKSYIRSYVANNAAASQCRVLLGLLDLCAETMYNSKS